MKDLQKMRGFIQVAETDKIWKDLEIGKTYPEREFHGCQFEGFKKKLYFHRTQDRFFVGEIFQGKVTLLKEFRVTEEELDKWSSDKCKDIRWHVAVCEDTSCETLKKIIQKENKEENNDCVIFALMASRKNVSEEILEKIYNISDRMVTSGRGYGSWENLVIPNICKNPNSPKALVSKITKKYHLKEM